MTRNLPLVGIIMGSQSDWATMKRAASVLDDLKVPYETKIVSPTAPRTGFTSTPKARSRAG